MTESRTHGPRPLALLIGMALGVALGILFRTVAPGAPWIAWLTENVAGPIGQIFLRGLFMLVVPLLFSGLVVGVCELDLKKLGAIGGRTIGYTVLASTVSVIIGLKVQGVMGAIFAVPVAAVISTFFFFYLERSPAGGPRDVASRAARRARPPPGRPA